MKRKQRAIAADLPENSAEKPTTRSGKPLRPGMKAGHIYAAGVPGNRGGSGRPITHGRRSKLLQTRPRYRELFEQFLDEKDPLNLHRELAHARALFVDFIERYDQSTEALLAWHASFTKHRETDVPRPRQVLDISTAHQTLLTIAKIVETIERIRGNVTRPELLRIMEEMGRVTEHHVRLIAVQVGATVTEDEARKQVAAIVETQRAAIEKGWLSIPLV